MDRSQAGKKGYEKTREQLNAHREAKSKKAREEYECNPKTCPTCGIVLPYEKRRNQFCSKSCSATYNNRGVIRVETVNNETCAYCGETKEKRHNKYCDACIREAVYNPPKTLDEIKSERTLRKYLLRERENRCESCGLEEWLGAPIPLEVHHVDGNPGNNVETNLQLLCPNCHAMTDFFKNAGRQSPGRFSLRRVKRRKRYEEGKSW